MVSTMYNDVVTLLVEKTIRDEVGMKQTFYEEREVFAEELPIGILLYSVYRFRNDFHHTELYCEVRSGLHEHKG